MQHAGLVKLVMSLSTGLASPQFYVHYDDGFKILKQGADQVTSRWQQLAALEKIIPKMTFDKSSLPIAVYQPTVVGPTMLDKLLEAEKGSEVDTNESSGS
jgi:hypothetical protein